MLLFAGTTRKEELYFSFLIVYYIKKKCKNMQIMFEKLYRTYLGGTTQMCLVQFLEHDPYIFVYNVSDYICIVPPGLRKIPR